jgi:hypothetical protein
MTEEFGGPTTGTLVSLARVAQPLLLSTLASHPLCALIISEKVRLGSWG